MLVWLKICRNLSLVPKTGKADCTSFHRFGYKTHGCLRECDFSPKLVYLKKNFSQSRNVHQAGLSYLDLLALTAKAISTFLNHFLSLIY